MNFENIVISPPDNYRFLNFVPSVIDLLSDRKIYKLSGGLLEYQWTLWAHHSISASACPDVLNLTMVSIL